MIILSYEPGGAGFHLKASRSTDQIGIFLSSSVYLIERPRICEAAFPCLVNDLLSLLLALAIRPSHDALHCSSPDASLVLLGKGPVSSAVKFSHEATLAAQTACSDFCTCCMLEIHPVDLEANVVPSVYHFMCHDIFGMLLCGDPVCTYSYAVVGVEASFL